MLVYVTWYNGMVVKNSFISLIQEHVSSPKQKKTNWKHVFPALRKGFKPEILTIHFQSILKANTPLILPMQHDSKALLFYTKLLSDPQNKAMDLLWVFDGKTPTHDVPLLLYTKLLPHLHDKAMDLLWVFQRRRHTLLFLAPLGLSDQLGALHLYAEVTKALIRIKQGWESHQSHIHKPKFLTTKVRLLSKLSFQNLKVLYEFILVCFLLFSFGWPYPPSKFIELWKVMESKREKACFFWSISSSFKLSV